MSIVFNALKRLALKRPALNRDLSWKETQLNECSSSCCCCCCCSIRCVFALAGRYCTDENDTSVCDEYFVNNDVYLIAAIPGFASGVIASLLLPFPD